MVVVAVPQGQGLLQHSLHAKREAGGRRRSDLEPVFAAAKQMTQAALMAGSKKLVIHFPTIVGEPTFVVGRAAEILGRSPATLKRWRYEGIGPEYVEIGGRVRYDQDSVLESGLRGRNGRYSPTHAFATDFR